MKQYSVRNFVMKANATVSNEKLDISSITYPLYVICMKMFLALFIAPLIMISSSVVILAILKD